MNDSKPGIKTSEFWITAILNIAGAAIGILAGRGLLSNEEGELWIALIGAVALAVIPLALAIVNAAYINSRGKVKSAAGRGIND